MKSDAIDTRLLRLIDEMVKRGVSATEAATIAAKTILEGENHKAWLTPEEAAEKLNVHPRVLTRTLRAGSHVFKGAKKFCGLWRIPAAVVTPN